MTAEQLPPKRNVLYVPTPTTSFVVSTYNPKRIYPPCTKRTKPRVNHASGVLILAALAKARCAFESLSLESSVAFGGYYEVNFAMQTLHAQLTVLGLLMTMNKQINLQQINDP